MSTTPSWPSLYNLAVELFPIEHEDPVQPGGRYLHDPHDIFRFTLYWTFVLYVPSFIICGIYAFFNLSFPPRGLSRIGSKSSSAHSSSYRSRGSDSENIPLRRRHDRGSLGATDVRSQSQSRASSSRTRAKTNKGRSRLTFALLVFLMFATFAFGGAVVGSAIIGYVLAGLFKAAEYNMSTWIPFLGAVMQMLVGFLALWPTIVDII